jgi:ADP-ribose pyrophosphatase YjhB (NUDIX family)
LPEPDGPRDPTVSASPIEEVRPGRFTLMAAGWMPPTHLVTQALGLCFTADGLVVMVTMDGRQWSLPGGTVEDGESVEQALVREVAEEACARVVRCQYLASQHVADPLSPDGRPSYYQSRWWARVDLDPWQPQDEMTGRRLVPLARSWTPCGGGARRSPTDCSSSRWTQTNATAPCGRARRICVRRRAHPVRGEGTIPPAAGPQAASRRTRPSTRTRADRGSPCPSYHRVHRWSICASRPRRRDVSAGLA